MPPPDNNYSAAGDIAINTGVAFNIGSDIDLFTVISHEVGHALGLLESTDPNAVMYGYYNGMKTPNVDDIVGVRTIYSNGQARSTDQFGGTNTSFSTAANINSFINQNTLTAVVNPLDIYTPPFQEYLTWNNPANTSSTLTITVQSTGLSLLAPTMTVYNYLYQQVAYASGAGQYGTTISVTLTNIHPGRQVYLEIAGADNSPFATGNYAVTFQWGSTPPGTVPSPIVQVPNGNPIQSGGGLPDGLPTTRSGDANDGRSSTSVFPASLVTVVRAQDSVQPTHWQTVTVGSGTSTATSVPPPLPQAAPSVQSGTAENADVPLLDFNPDELVDPAILAPAAPSTARAGVQQVQGSIPVTLSWREPPSAWFATGQDKDKSDAKERQAEPGRFRLDHAAALVSMSLVLGSYWASPSQEKDERRSRRDGLTGFKSPAVAKKRE